MRREISVAVATVALAIVLAFAAMDISSTTPCCRRSSGT